MLIRLTLGILAVVAICAPALGDGLLAFGDGLYYEYDDPHEFWFEVGEVSGELFGEFHLVCPTLDFEFHTYQILRYESSGFRAVFVCRGAVNGEKGWVAFVHVQDAPPGWDRPDWISIELYGENEYGTAGPVAEGDIVVIR